MRRICCLFATFGVLFFAQPCFAWFDGGHMLVAYIAYQKLTPQTQARVDALIRLNPLYAQWTDGVADSQKSVVAFVHAATWADCIKSPACAPGYRSDGGNNPPGQPTDAQNIGYADKLKHQYWHFVDYPYSAGAPGQPPKTPNAQSEIELLTAAISSVESDDVKSYDVVWLEHLVGDIHQPLHATSRFTKNHPNGDAGGNFLTFCELPCKDELHAYWDGLPGDKPTVDDVMKTGNQLLAAGIPAGVDDATPGDWAQESFQLSKTAVYVAPIGDDNDPAATTSPRPDDAYAAKALQAAQTRVTQAGYRLAALLNNNLK